MKLMLIGGGDIGKSGTKYETGAIDKKIVYLLVLQVILRIHTIS